MEAPLEGMPLAEMCDGERENVAIDSEPGYSPDDVVDLMLTVLSDGLDHPELWEAVPGFVDVLPDLVGVLQQRLALQSLGSNTPLLILLAMCGAAKGHGALMIEELEPLAAEFSQSPLVQGALFHLHGLIDPDNPKYRLAGKICPNPFTQLDVLERNSYLCCASFLNTPIGSMSKKSWKQVWNSGNAQAIRESIHDGSYRYCNKGTCPAIQSNSLVPAADMAARSGYWRDIVETAATVLSEGPASVNLAYDRTCNLSCPSCRTTRFAADEKMRARFEALQERAILPLLKGARTVFVTGSGDPFASKNFRRLIEQLTVEDYPDLRFQIMTNGMLFTPRQWENFPSLHRRVQTLKISIDAATGPTHELLRRGARWPVMLENMAFAGALRTRGEIDHLELVFTVQADNYREMGDAIELARSIGADSVFFARMTNWGTFSDAEYREKAVFLAEHPEHADFLRRMQDPRLRDPIALLGDLTAFVEPDAPSKMAA